jgi:type I protein arginine methyltransferase
MYALPSFGGMVGRGVRYAAYTAALRKAVHETTTVLDIGCGPGFWAIIAARYGAARVYAIEPDESIRWGQEAARRLGLADRVRFLRGLSTGAHLPEQVDCIVSDLRGCLPLFSTHIPSVVDARTRLLKPGGRLIAARDTMWAAIVEVPGFHRKLTEPWLKQAWKGAYEPALDVILNQPHKYRFRRSTLMSRPERWAALDYATIESPDVSASLEFSVERAGTGHGIGVWFDAELAEGIGFSNAPGEPELVYGRLVLPWLKPVALAAGDRVRLDIRGKFVNDDYVWTWCTELPGRLRFEQNTVHTLAASMEELRCRAGNAVPSLGQDAAIDAFILNALDGRTSVMAAAEAVVAAFPGRFRNIADAMSRVGDLAVKYGKSRT